MPISAGADREARRLARLKGLATGIAVRAWCATVSADDSEWWVGYFSIPPETEMSSPVTNDDALLAR